jgi:hypothetical protein
MIIYENTHTRLKIQSKAFYYVFKLYMIKKSAGYVK